MAVGEAACVSVHGANRLGSNSLIDLVVFGRAAGLRCAEQLKPGATQPELPAAMTDGHLARFDRFRNAKGGTPTAKLRARHAARDAVRLRRLPHRRDAGRGRQARSTRSRRPPTSASPTARLIWNTDLVETLEFDNLIARRRSPSNGAPTAPKAAAPTPARTSRPRRQANWMKHTLAWFDGSITTGKVTIDYRPVHTYTMSNDIDYIRPRRGCTPTAKEGEVITGWYLVSPDTGAADVKVRTGTLRRGIFDVPTYKATASLTAGFSKLKPVQGLPTGAVIDWSRAQIVLGFSDLRGAQTDVVATLTTVAGDTRLEFTPASDVRLGRPMTPPDSDGRPGRMRTSATTAWSRPRPRRCWPPSRAEPSARP
jgi:hypothetical protein